jgi:hypothetical protein
MKVIKLFLLVKQKCCFVFFFFLNGPNSPLLHILRICHTFLLFIYLQENVLFTFSLPSCTIYSLISTTNFVIRKNRRASILNILKNSFNLTDTTKDQTKTSKHCKPASRSHLNHVRSAYRLSKYIT